MSERRIVFGADNHRWVREWQGGVSGTWWRARSYRTRFFAVLAAVMHSPGSRQLVVDTGARR